MTADAPRRGQDYVDLNVVRGRQNTSAPAYMLGRHPAIGTALVPRLWSDPMGPMLKVLPILALHLAALGLIDDR